MSNIQWVKKAMDELGKKYLVVGESQNTICYNSSNGNQHFFSGYVTPLNSQSFAMICRDKGYTYTLLHETVPMAKTLRVYDPEGSSEKKVSYEHAIDSVCKEFSFPCIIKMNRGTMGKHIFKCMNQTDIEDGLHTIFTRDKHYDFIALAQEFIEIEQEYRVVVYNNAIQFVYLKDTNNAAFTGNLSPLHFDGAKAVLVTEKNILQELQEFVRKISETVQLPYNGLDVVRNGDGKLLLIELNAAPQFIKFVEDNGPSEVIGLYKKIILDLD